MSSVAPQLPAELTSHPVGTVAGSLSVAADKSISHRALLISAIADGTSEIDDLLESADCHATLQAVRALGVSVEQPAVRRTVVHGCGFGSLRLPGAPLDLGNSGTAIRLLMGLLAGQGVPATLTGDASLRRRPMERVAEPLRAMGANVRTERGHPPVRIDRPTRALHGIDYELPVASAQVKSALLLAGLAATGQLRLREPAASRDHTERMLEACGVPLRRSGCELALRGPVERLAPLRLAVPGDFSSAAFWLVAAALAPAGRLRLVGVGVNPSRTGLLDALRRMGAQIELERPRTVCGEPVADLRVDGGARLRAIELAGAEIPRTIDELPLLFIVAACAEGVTRVRDAAELRHKESDRLAVMAEGLVRLGIEVRLHSDGLEIAGGTLHGGEIDSAGDHRIAMAFAVAAVRAAGPLKIRDVAHIATSYPGFVDDGRRLGLRLDPRP